MHIDETVSLHCVWNTGDYTAFLLGTKISPSPPVFPSSTPAPSTLTLTTPPPLCPYLWKWLKTYFRPVCQCEEISSVNWNTLSVSVSLLLIPAWAHKYWLWQISSHKKKKIPHLFLHRRLFAQHCIWSSKHPASEQTKQAHLGNCADIPSIFPALRNLPSRRVGTLGSAFTDWVSALLKKPLFSSVSNGKKLPVNLQWPDSVVVVESWALSRFSLQIYHQCSALLFCVGPTDLTAPVLSECCVSVRLLHQLCCH